MRGYCLTDEIKPKLILLHRYSQSDDHLLEFYYLLEMFILKKY